MLSNFSVSFFLLNATGTASAVFGIMGAIILIGAIIPPFLETLRSRKTYGISNKFFLFYIIGNFFFTIVSILIIVNATDVGPKIFGSTMVLTNIFSFAMNSYMFKIKIKNMRLAKEHGMCEMDYYNNFIVNSRKENITRVASDEEIE